MAIIAQPESAGFDIEALAPAGTYIATCLEVQDQFGVERPKFENPQEKEILDVTRFLFGFNGQDGRPYKVQSFEFRISGSPKSNLFKFLTSWLGSPPKYGWDYCELKAQGAMITVAHKLSRDGSKTYANLVGISPVIDQLKAQVLPPGHFDKGASTAPASPSAQNPLAPAPQGSAAPQQQPQLSNAQNHAAAPQAGGGWNPAVDSDNDCPF